MTHMALIHEHFMLSAPGVYMHVLSFDDGDTAREHYAHLIEVEMASVRNAAPMDDGAWSRVADLLNRCEAMVCVGHEALFLGANLVHRCFIFVSDQVDALTLVVTAALLLSSKFCNASSASCRLAHKVAFAAGLAVELRLQKELEIIHFLRFRVWSCTPWTFFCAHVADDEHRAVAQSVLLLSLGSASVRGYPASLIATSARHVRNTILGRPPWSATEEDLTWYSERQLQDCADKLLTLVPSVTSGAANI